ncbi:MAG TPA: universal stress protein, partial [Polyangiaceae bacterium]|nr:universal stress protein [Polyangiaceae bacterium]
TLFVPHGVGGFVSQTDGSLSLANILIPVTGKPRAQPAVDASARLIRVLDLAPGTVTLLHVGSEGDMPALKIPGDTNFHWQRWTRAGSPVETILEAAAELSADLIAMTTDGPDGFLDGLRGTTSERVLQRADCPVACLPVGSLLG